MSGSDVRPTFAHPPDDPDARSPSGSDGLGPDGTAHIDRTDDTTVRRTGENPTYDVLRVFDWLDAVAAARDPASGKRLPDGLLRAAMTLVRGGKALTGRGIVVPVDHMAAAIGVDRRTVERYVSQLRDLGYLTQTRRPSPIGPATYDLTGPTTHDRRKSGPVGRSPDTVERERVGRQRGPSADTTRREAVGRSDLNARQNRGVTPDTAERERVAPNQENQYFPHLQQTTWPSTSIDDGQGNDLRQTLDLLARFAGRPVDGCAQAVRDRLERGWSPGQLEDHVRRAGDLNGSRDVAAVLTKRIRELGAPPPVVPPKCDACDSNRMVELEDGRVTHCPICHPNRKAPNR